MRSPLFFLFSIAACSLTLGSLVPAQGQIGTVLDDLKVGAGAGGFGGGLAPNDGFGRSVTSLGDLDGDGVGDLLVGAPREFDAINSEGKVWVLFLEPDGSVRDEVEIASGGDAGFVGPLGATDRFGWSVALLGDLPSMGPPGSIEVAVGASGTDVGGSNRGAAWILSLDTTGSVQAERQLFGLGLSNEDQFGSSVCRLGDLDGDSVPELVVGARLANDGAVDAGAIWVLRLNADGTIKAQTRVSQLVGGFSGAGGALVAQDNFGAALASPGDADADGVPDLVVGAPGDTAGAGALWVLYLNATTGSVKDTHRIAAVAGVGPGDRFGESLAVLGDLDLAGGFDLAVGAPRDDDGLTDRGALWIVFLDANEMAIGEQKISDTDGAFDGALNGGLFGASVAPLGDLDGDGRLELAVGEAAAFAPSVGVGAGALWILSLVGPQDSVWTGIMSTDWFDPLNWSAGLPGPALAAVIRNVANDPVVGLNVGLDAECLDLALASGASLSLPELTERLTVHQDVRVMGFVSGVGELCLAGDGSLMATSPIEVPVVVDTAGTVELRGPAVALQDGLRLVAGRIEVCEGCLTTVVGTADFGAGLLRGAGRLDIDGPAFFAGTDVAAPPTLCFSGDVEVDAAFVPASGCVIFDGSAPQTIVQTAMGLPVQLFEVRVEPSASVSTEADLSLASDLSLEGDLDFGQVLDIDGSLMGAAGAATLTSNGGGGMGSCAIRIGGDAIWGGGLFSSCMFEMDNPSGLTVLLDHAGGFPGDLIINTLGVVQLGSTTLTVGGNMKVLAGTFQSGTDALITVDGVDGIAIEAPGRFDLLNRAVSILAGANGTPIAVRGELQVRSGGALLLQDNVVSVESGGTLKLTGTLGNPARVDGIGSVGYQLSVLDGAGLEADWFRFENMAAAGVRIAQPVAGSVVMSNGLFDRAALNGTLLEVTRLLETSFDGIVFENTGGLAQFNVRVPSGSAPISFSNWSGAFGGPSFDAPSEEALWGATLQFLVVNESAAQNRILWRTSRESNVVSFELDRATLPGSLFDTSFPTATAQGSGLYSFTDLSITPGQGYRYRLRERLTSGMTTVLNVLGERLTDGVPGPVALPEDPPSTFLPLSGQGPHAGHPQFVPLPGGFLASMRLAAGRHALPEIPRAFRGPLRIVCADSGAVVLDASAGPLTIRGLRADQTVELARLEIDAGDPERLALVIEDCVGALLLDQVVVRGQVRLGACPNVLLQGCTLDGVALERRSEAVLLATECEQVALFGASRLTSHGAGLVPSVESGSRWIERRGLLSWLEAEADSGGLEVRFESAPGTLAWLSSAETLADLLSGPCWDGGRLGPSTRIRSSPLGPRLTLPPELLGSTLYLRAVTFSPEEQVWGTSNVLVPKR